jgi:hypothetical protein
MPSAASLVPEHLRHQELVFAEVQPALLENASERPAVASGWEASENALNVSPDEVSAS